MVPEPGSSSENLEMTLRLDNSFKESLGPCAQFAFFNRRTPEARFQRAAAQQADFQVVGEADDDRLAVDLAASLHPSVAGS
jgi:hypothetical protein